MIRRPKNAEMNYFHTTDTCTAGCITDNAHQPGLQAQRSIHSYSPFAITPAGSTPRSCHLSESDEDHPLWLLPQSPEDHTPSPEKVVKETLPAIAPPFFFTDSAYGIIQRRQGRIMLARNLLVHIPVGYSSDGSDQTSGSTIRLDQTCAEVFFRRDPIPGNRQNRPRESTTLLHGHGLEVSPPRQYIHQN